jgi:sugar-specific transcriptional regulator TrmB
MEDSLVRELEEIGLSEKEARVYLAALELGPATAQQIAVKAIINRPTTYIMIESLIKRGLMSCFVEGKKKKFSAAMPYKLAYMIKNQKRELEKKEKKFNSLIKKMQPFFTRENAIKIEVFSGIESFSACQDFILRSEPDEVLELTSIRKAKRLMPDKELKGDIRKQICRRHHVNSLCAVSNEKTNKRIPRLFKRVTINDVENPIGSEIIIYRDTIFFNTYNKQLQTIMITDSDIALTIKTLYKALWEKAK